ncbi:glycosyltransferase family 2 protein [Butyrivibrio proteoclasticus]|uniref:glycosyltransferase family 2 protein n=1 Tax=Butyrivibrio proteoclasticus TaxID=43305 RepID=UPI0018CC555F|nr:glycosyltransferase family 2 protein [Butyrivibrio proteoclasticus]
MISIIIPIYNAENYLKRCLDSVVSQTYKDLEIILIDDGSTDKSAQICDEYCHSDKRVVVIHKKNEGVVKARNTGLTIAHGDFIGFIDSDDYIVQDMYQYMIKIYDSTGADIVCCGVSRRYRGSGKEYNTRYFEGVRLYDKEEALYKFQLNDDIGVAAWNKIFKKEIIAKIEFENYKRMDDARFVCRAIQNSKSVAYGAQIKYIYEIRGNSLTQSGFNENAYDILKVADVNFKSISAMGLVKYDYFIGQIIWYIVFSNEMIKGNYVDYLVIRKIKKMIRDNWGIIKRNNDLKLVRKIQLFMVGNCFFMYSILYRMHCKVNGK